MNISMRWIYLILICCLVNNNDGRVKLFHTENAFAVQSYDCIYYTNVTAENNETTPYCIRTNESISLNRSFSINTCENSGKEWSFKRLKEMNVSQDEVLEWNSGIEIADRYAAYLITGNEKFADDTICNCSPNTFGKFCEYEFMTKNTFEDSIQYQFDLKMRYRNGSQLWGNITCYTTLTNCYYGLRCLTWQNICDGKQQCMYGIDEDGCEELEYNECENDEYRCDDGSCIPEEYWLDGQFDCSDKSDEQKIGEEIENVYFCPLTSSRFDCDEATAHHQYFACGDGEFVFDSLTVQYSYCYNYRLIMFFCEFPWEFRPKPPKWTLTNGYCVEDASIEKNITDMDESQQCMFYLKCKLMNRAASTICNDIIRNFHFLCYYKNINYPSKPFFKSYVQTGYNVSNLESSVFISQNPTHIRLNGSIKCIGRQTPSELHLTSSTWSEFINSYRFDTFFCETFVKSNVTDLQMDTNCRSDKYQSFFCNNSLQCISQHRLRNGIIDCRYQEDELYDQECYMKKQHRLNCSEELSLCLSVSEIGDGILQCEEGNDEYIAQLKWNLVDRKCKKPNSIECNALKSYIQSSSAVTKTESDKAIIFREYCDTIWQLPKGFDESLCKKWKCPKDQYQCLSGHCIPIENVLDTRSADWHCPDASDSIGLIIEELSDHNVQLLIPDDTAYKQLLFVEFYRSHFLAFRSNCTAQIEYGCILADVDDPLNFTINLPCINITQIGDGIIDCYGGLDERNLLTCGDNVYEQRGFDFHCSDQECIPYHQLCEKRCSNKADSLLCDELKTLWNSSCQYPTRMGMCSDFSDPQCDLKEVSKYYCDMNRHDTFRIHRPAFPYRFKSSSLRKLWLFLREYPVLKNSVADEYAQTTQHDKTINIHPSTLHKEEENGKEGWICGRGVTIKTNKGNKIQCFCPPSLYGEYCQYYSDRITVIVSFNNIPLQLLEKKSNAIKILALLLSDNDTIIDYHIFYLPSVLSKELNKKFRFNLIHQRPKLLSNSYKVQFKAYYLNYADSSMKFVGIWEYSIQFPFLPSYRLVQILRFEKQSILNNTTSICETANPCLHDSTCHSIMNKINDTSAYYCHCNNQTFGKHCQHLLEITPSSICSKNALLHPLSSSKSICLCPIHTYGPTCHLDSSCVNDNPCGVSRGKCYVNPDDPNHDYICVCDKKFFGDHCQFDSAMVEINFTDFSFVQIPSNYILSTIIQLGDLHNETLDLNIQQKHVYQGLPPSVVHIHHNDHHLPRLGIMKLYHQQVLTNKYLANLKQPDYFILYIISSNVSNINITSSVNGTNYCPYTPNAFQKNISDVSYLSQFLNEANLQNEFNVTVKIFEYHLLCDEPYSLMCFHDDNYFCLCDMNKHAECSRYDSTLDQCNEQCRAGGQCIHGDLENERDFICLCPRCYYGSICQHNTELFSFTLETLLTNDLYSPSVVIRHLFSSLLIIIPFILFLIGIVNNIFCYVTFNRPKPLLVGIGHYLRTASIINQLVLFILFLKLLHLILSIKGYIVHQLINTILCKVLSYLLTCTNRMSYWFMGMVAIERVYVTWHIKGTWLKSPRIAKRIIGTTIIGILVSNVHEVVYYQSIDDPASLDTNNTWCITSYPSIVGKYNQVNIILNYIIPFLINFLSTIILIILITRKRVFVIKKKTDDSKSKSKTRWTIRAYIDLLTKEKELIFPPLVTMLSFLLQFILSFSLACQEFKINWQRYLLIISYFITYIPQILLYKLYIASSSFYKKEFHATKLYKRIARWRGIIDERRLQAFTSVFGHTDDITMTKL